jgi:hypothetical protein
MAQAATAVGPQTGNSSQRTSSYCLGQVAKKDGAGALLDAASLIPGGGEVADMARFLGAVASTEMSSTTTGAVVGGTATATTVATNAYHLNPTLGLKGVAKDSLEAIPVIGTVVGAGAFLYDGYSAYQDYVNCMAGQ